MSRTAWQRQWRRLRRRGLPWLAGALRDRLRPARPSFRDAAAAALAGGRGLEVGGPSRVFRAGGGLPVYAWAATLDNVNFAADTAWEREHADGSAFHFHRGKPPGRQWLREATALTGVADGAYDFVVSSHCLEHVANPLRALREWRRVTRPGGHLVVLLPDPARTFDHRRPRTTLAHLRADAERGTGEDDATHLAEVLALHDLDLDPGAGDPAEFAAHCRDNARCRRMHHHVFDVALLAAALAEAGWQVRAAEPLAPLHLAAWAQHTTAP